MNTLIDDQFMKVSEATDILTLEWKSETSGMTDMFFKEEALLFIDQVKNGRYLKILVDMRNFRGSLSPDILAWRDKHIISVYNDIGVKKFAFVNEKPTVSQDDPNNTFVTKYFTDSSAAFQWLAN